VRAGALSCVLKVTTELIRTSSPAALTNDLCRRHLARHCTRTRHQLDQRFLSGSRTWL